MTSTNIFSVCLVSFNKEGKLLAVSRKYDHSDMGLPGGKIDPGETKEEAILREVKEETGLDITNLKFQFVRQCIDDKDKIDKSCGVFTGDVIGTINHNEPHIVDWVDPIVITKGSFGDFNISTMEKLNIKY